MPLRRGDNLNAFVLVLIIVPAYKQRAPVPCVIKAFKTFMRETGRYLVVRKSASDIALSLLTLGRLYEASIPSLFISGLSLDDFCIAPFSACSAQCGYQHARTPDSSADPGLLRGLSC